MTTASEVLNGPIDPYNPRTKMQQPDPPGSYCWSRSNSIFRFNCPRCGHCVKVDLAPGQWDGNGSTPTLSVSLTDAYCGWHGTLTGGEFSP